MLKIFRFFKRLFKAAARSTASVNTVSVDEKIQESITKPEANEQKEIAWFTKANDLVAEFAYTPQPVYSSNFSDPEPIGYMDSNGKVHYNKDIKDRKPEIIDKYKGYIIFAFNKEELAHRRSMIDNGFTKEYLTIEDYDKMIETNEMGNIPTADDPIDVIFEASKKYIADKRDEKSRTYIIGADDIPSYTDENHIFNHKGKFLEYLKSIQTKKYLPKGTEIQMRINCVREDRRPVIFVINSNNKTLWLRREEFDQWKLLLDVYDFRTLRSIDISYIAGQTHQCDTGININSYYMLIIKFNYVI